MTSKRGGASLATPTEGIWVRDRWLLHLQVGGALMLRLGGVEDVPDVRNVAVKMMGLKLKWRKKRIIRFELESKLGNSELSR